MPDGTLAEYGDQESSGGALAYGIAAAKAGGQEGSAEGEVRPEGRRRYLDILEPAIGSSSSAKPKGQ